jgi:mRNA interferase RelE/StbE
VPFRLQIAPAARKQIARLDETTRRRVREELDRLCRCPRHRGVVKLNGSIPWWRAKVGRLRVIYSIHPKQMIVRVALVAGRGSAYRDTGRLTFEDPEALDSEAADE